MRLPIPAGFIALLARDIGFIRVFTCDTPQPMKRIPAMPLGTESFRKFSRAVFS
jgi:hypothetical protein